nr:PREDICTED: abscisic acid 8'-hydroxylase 4-like isoform X2 [Daucus carota subsp. sativus]
MEFLGTGIYVTFFLCTLLLYYLIKKAKIGQKHEAKLPPGSMGLPYFGETLQLYSQDPNVLFATKQKRYGDVFKTHILGCPCVMLASPEAARFVLVTHASLFKPTYPKSKEKLIGPSALFFHQGKYHARLRKLVQNSLSPEAIRKLIPDIEVTAISTLDTCVKARLTNTFQEMKKARDRITHILSKIIRERRDKRLSQKDLLGHLLDFRYDNGSQTLTDDQIADNIIGVLFAAQDTTASMITWILKYLHDDRKLLQAVKDEQMSICESNNGGKLPLTWAHTRNMPITLGVILESLRMASIISYTFREAVVDVEYNGYLIPKGWKVMPLFRNIHHNSEFFTDPQKFDSSRFQVAPKPNTYMPFGNGVHACPGNELAKLEILILIHHLVTKYRWDVVDSSDMIQYCPFPVPLHGLPARFRKDQTQSVAITPSNTS